MKLQHYLGRQIGFGTKILLHHILSSILQYIYNAIYVLCIPTMKFNFHLCIILLVLEATESTTYSIMNPLYGWMRITVSLTHKDYFFTLGRQLNFWLSFESGLGINLNLSGMVFGSTNPIGSFALIFPSILKIHMFND